MAMQLNRTSPSMSDSGFFAISRPAFHQVCTLGVNEACLYLVYACGTGKSNDKTSWSNHALTRYTQITRSRAKKAAASLISEKLVKQIKGGKHPRFQLMIKADDERVWLPKEFVRGASKERPPIERLRQTGDVMMFRLIIDFYAKANIADEGGVPRDIVSGLYESERIAEQGEFTVYGFNQVNQTCFCNHGVIEPHVNDYLGDRFKPFWNRLKMLRELGLIYPIPTLFDGEDGEVLFPLVNPFTVEEIIDLTLPVRERWLPELYDEPLSTYDYVLAVPQHIQNVWLANIYVLRYRQKTALTAAAFAQTMDRIAQWSEIYANKQLVISREHQGCIKGTSKVTQGGIKG